MGTGGIGGYFGGLLARAGHDVTFVARGQHLEAIVEAGLTVESSNKGDFTVGCKATDSPDGSDTPELLIFSVKMYQNQDEGRRCWGYYDCKRRLPNWFEIDNSAMDPNGKSVRINLRGLNFLVHLLVVH